ncbi:MAG: TIGR00153 family protein [Acidobacteriota bacterium]|nr:TIGR00153 family protein [Acidobacteriota bacterium]
MRSTNPIAALFGKSPIRPMQKHMAVVAECAARLGPLVAALQVGDWSRIAEIKDEIFALESEADDLKNEIRSLLPRFMMLPVDRRDLLDLLSSQDDIADAAQDVAGLLSVRRMAVPAELADKVEVFAARNIAAVSQCRDVINELDELLATSFRGRSADKVLAMVDELAGIESEADALGMELAAALFELEDDLEPLDVFFWYKLVHMMGRIADQAENVGDRIRLLIAR